MPLGKLGRLGKVGGSRAVAVPNPTWAPVQHAASTTGTGTTKALAFAAPVTSGNIVVGGVLTQNALCQVKTVTDDKGNTYDIVGQDGTMCGEPTNLNGCAFKSRGGLTNAPQTITITTNISSAMYWVLIDEFTAGFPLPATCDSDGSQGFVKTTTQPFLTNYANNLLYFPVFATAAATPGAGWTATQGSGSQQMAMYRQSGAAGLQTIAWTTSGDIWGQCIAVHQSATQPRWRLRQSTSQRTAANVTSGGTASVTFDQAVASGSLIVGSIAVGTNAGGDNNVANIATLVDDKGRSYKPFLTPNFGGRSWIYSGTAPVTDGPITITATTNHTEVILYFTVHEFVPPTGATAFAAEPGTGIVQQTGSSPFTVGTVTPSRNNALIFADIDNGGPGNMPTWGGASLLGLGMTWSHSWYQQPIAAAISPTYVGGAGVYAQGVLAITYT